MLRQLCSGFAVGGLITGPVYGMLLLGVFAIMPLSKPHLANATAVQMHAMTGNPA